MKDGSTWVLYVATVVYYEAGDREYDQREVGGVLLRRPRDEEIKFAIEEPTSWNCTKQLRAWGATKDILEKWLTEELVPRLDLSPESEARIERGRRQVGVLDCSPPEANGDDDVFIWNGIVCARAVVPPPPQHDDNRLRIWD